MGRPIFTPLPTPLETDQHRPHSYPRSLRDALSVCCALSSRPSTAFREDKPHHHPLRRLRRRRREGALRLAFSPPPPPGASCSPARAAGPDTFDYPRANRPLLCSQLGAFNSLLFYDLSRRCNIIPATSHWQQSTQKSQCRGKSAADCTRPSSNRLLGGRVILGVSTYLIIRRKAYLFATRAA